MPASIEMMDEIVHNNNRKKKVVVLGGDVAAGYFVKEFVEAGRGAEVCIITHEPELPYEHSTLSKDFLWKENPARLPSFLVPLSAGAADAGGVVQTAEWYEENGVEVITSTKIAKVDAVKKTLSTLSGTCIEYDRLVIATGCSAPHFPEGRDSYGKLLTGVFNFCNHADATQLYQFMEDSWNSAKVAHSNPCNAVVVGGDSVALELAASLAAWGFPVHMIVPDQHLMSDLWPKELADLYEAELRARGVTLHAGARVAKVVEGEPGHA
eukprot:CAMPEP_0118939054 /NCGR_PEP_ID=MMETSP1169-20130426/27828_1 /TAXON_ID=36882 /ORGANISM="Pyramimonas obovata, Strain CCMP722" /LENGTH=266 /DNA_ID=CAMNT_0006883225 /DNA_START=70 /DNA_END=866 /DNA_ORIENTATION=-